MSSHGTGTDAWISKFPGFSFGCGKRLGLTADAIGQGRERAEDLKVGLKRADHDSGFTAVNLTLATFPSTRARSSLLGAGVNSLPGQQAIASNSSGVST